VLAMAAWFFLLCFVDDIVETLPLRAAKAGLRKAQQTMKRTLLLSRGKRKITPSERQEAHADVHIEREADAQQKVQHACKAFRSYVRDLLPRSTYKPLLQGVSEVFEGMIDEIEFREQRVPDVDAYLRIRVRTIGLSPLFILLGGYCFDHVPSRRVPALEMCVKVAVGMQNDLMGLEKDRSVGEWMNFAIIATMDHTSVTERRDGLLRCVKAHNAAVRQAVHCWELLQAGADDAERWYAWQLLRFVELHYQWACTASRYQMDLPN
jgi:hypothetical protein